MIQAKLTELKGVGPSIAGNFADIGIRTIEDLLNYFPKRYDDYSEISTIKSVKPGTVTIKAVIKQAKGRYVRRGMHVTEAIASDETGSVKLVWFNQPYRADSIAPGKKYFITGKLEFHTQGYSITSPSMELASELPVHTARIVPIYKQTKKLTTKLIRKSMAEAIKHVDDISEILPAEVIKNNNLLSYSQIVKQLHFPDSTEKLEKARYSMSFIEIFELMLASKILKNEISSENSPKISFDESLAKKFSQSLPFELTDAQRAAMWQILSDIQKTKPANRLLEGDVGSGKTVVAAMAAIMASRAGYQTALLAPTELLARQHAESVADLLKPLKMDGEISLLVGSLSKKQKEQIYQNLEKKNISIIIGTHALLQDINIPKLGLVIVDEQHRFGVEQRKKLLRQNSLIPHVLSMTATPIPRSLALTLYGELDISLLDSMPPGRKPIETKIISPNSRTSMEDHIRSEVGKKHQVYVVCPVITEDNKLQTTSAEQTYKRLKEVVFKDLNVALLHGKLKSEDKNNIMAKFVEGDIDILVSTTVIEVGVNVPNATIMVIEGADRFGLAQLHQLRGRVGRSSDQAYCYIVPSDSKAPSRRLKSFSQINDGFKLAELDMELRGPGAIYGTFQHGALDLKFANLSDHKLIAAAKKAVNKFTDIDQIKRFPLLNKRIRQAQAVVTLN